MIDILSRQDLFFIICFLSYRYYIKKRFYKEIFMTIKRVGILTGGGVSFKKFLYEPQTALVWILLSMG